MLTPLSQAQPEPPTDRKNGHVSAARRPWVAHWGTLGVVLLFGRASFRLGGLTLEALRMPLSALEITLCVFWVAFNAYGEGYRAFQLRFAPRIVRRAHELSLTPPSAYHFLAPLYCMSLVGAPLRSRVVAWGTVAFIAALVVTMRYVPQPYRGIIDSGVVVALLWGIAAMVYFHIRAARTGELPVVAPRRRSAAEPSAQPERDVLA